MTIKRSADHRDKQTGPKTKQPKPELNLKVEVLEERVAPIYFGQRFSFGFSSGLAGDKLSLNRCETLVGE